MRIKEITSQNRRDFRAIFVCESCNDEENMYGYDDSYFHNKVIPKMVCKTCKKTAPEDYRALTTKYPDGVLI